MRRLAPRPVAGALAEVTRGLAPRTLLARVQECWPEVAGPVMGAEAEPVSERAGTVTFTCASAVWAQELDLLSSELRERLNEALSTRPGEAPVKALRFVYGAVSHSRNRRKRKL